MMQEDRLKEIVSELVTRPGHEKVRGSLLRLLTDGLGAASTDITFEQQLNRFRVRGRIDALLGRTVFEIKSDLRRERRDADRQLETYIRDREAETRQPWVGVATDGAEYSVAMLRDNKLIELGTFKPNLDTPRTLLAWLESVVVLNVELTPNVDGIRTELGRDSIHYHRAMKEIETLWAGLETNPQALLKRDLWNRLLRVAYGADIGAPALFLQHTYLTVVAKSLATGAFTDKIPKTGAALLSGQAFRDLGIFGAIESDFFDWILLSDSGDELVLEIAQHANRFRLRDIESDILKGLYESLIDPAQRHDLGEYYTPDWLAERVCEATITDPLTQRVIDPACGSGTFLFHSVRRLLDAADRSGNPPAEAVALACEKIAGIDVHPVAVIFARATYLLALMPSLTKGRPSTLGVPVYLGDALQWNAREFMNQRDIEIVVPAERESLGALPDDDDEKRIILRFPVAVAAEPGLFDAAIEQMLNLAERKQPASAVTVWLKRNSVNSDADLRMLEETYRALQRLQREGRNHIWGYVARNLSRPIWLASEKQKADVVIGNPPWLDYKAMNKATQTRFREEMKATGLWEAKVHGVAFDLSAYFFARATYLYMRKTGRIAFVMPYAAMSRKSYASFRKGSFKVRGFTEAQVKFIAAWAFPSDVQPLFPVPACVLIAERSTFPAALPSTVTTYRGQLPTRDAHRAEADKALRARQEPWPTSDDGQHSPYASNFRAGAKLDPRRLILVEKVAAGRLGNNPDAPIVRGRTGTLDKEPWKKIEPPQGAVEAEFIKSVYLGESILPYRLLTPVLAVIPWSTDAQAILNSETAAKRGISRLSAWLANCEELWDKHGKGKTTFREKLDFYHLLTVQFPISKLRVVYAKSGTNPAAAVVRDGTSVIDHMLYWAAVSSEIEARYLMGILNSDTTRMRIEGRQSTGQWGARHFDKLAFELPIPKFESDNELHCDLASAVGEAEQAAVAVPLIQNEYFTRTRKRVRDALASKGLAKHIDDLVTRLLDRT